MAFECLVFLAERPRSNPLYALSVGEFWQAMRLPSACSLSRSEDQSACRYDDEPLEVASAGRVNDGNKQEQNVAEMAWLAAWPKGVDLRFDKMTI